LRQVKRVGCSCTCLPELLIEVPLTDSSSSREQLSVYTSSADSRNLRLNSLIALLPGKQPVLLLGFDAA
jgi:hypothetical protein